ncbi:MAG: hypothetical protein ACRDU5_05430 [Mycobacterium sp.]
MADDELDDLYGVKPEEFTALRSSLAAAAKQRGDAAAAKRISAARRPTTAAWIVNLLARSNADVKQSLADLGERLRAAHAAMDGTGIRELSLEQRELVDKLTRAAFDAAELPNPTAALREDVTGTLQAAVADPDVTARLGRLSKAERWSGFGEFGDTTAVFTVARKPKSEPKAERPRESLPQRKEASAALAAAEQAKDQADQQMSERQTDLAVARLHHEDARERLQQAERRLRAADDAYGAAKQASRDAAERVKAAKSRLQQSDRNQ